MSDYSCNEHGYEFHEDCAACEAADDWVSQQRRIAELEAEVERLRKAIQKHKSLFNRAAVKAAELKATIDDREQTIYLLSNQQDTVQQENQRLDRENNTLREIVQPRTEQVIEWAAKYERLREAVSGINPNNPFSVIEVQILVEGE